MLKAAVRPIESETTTPAPKTRPRIVKKKARTVQAMEFASDEEWTDKRYNCSFRVASLDDDTDICCTKSYDSVEVRKVEEF